MYTRACVSVYLCVSVISMVERFLCVCVCVCVCLCVCFRVFILMCCVCFLARSRRSDHVLVRSCFCEHGQAEIHQSILFVCSKLFALELAGQEIQPSRFPVQMSRFSKVYMECKRLWTENQLGFVSFQANHKSEQLHHVKEPYWGDVCMYTCVALDASYAICVCVCVCIYVCQCACIHA